MYTLRLDPKVGQLYSIHTKIAGDQTIGVDLLEKALRSDDKQIVMEVRLGNVTLNGQPVGDALKSVVMTITEDHFAHVLDVAVTGAPVMVADLLKEQARAGLVFPDHAVKLGDIWTGETQVSGKNAQATYRLVKVVSLQGKDAAMIVATVNATGPVKVDGPITETVDLATGLLLESKAQVEDQGQKQTVEQTRV